MLNKIMTGKIRIGVGAVYHPSVIKHASERNNGNNLTNTIWSTIWKKGTPPPGSNHGGRDITTSSSSSRRRYQI